MQSGERRSLGDALSQGSESSVEFDTAPIPSAEILPIPPPDGDSARGVGESASDTVRQADIQRQLLESDARLRFALAAARMVAWDLDLVTDQCIRSDNAAELLGAESNSADDYFRLIHPDDKPAVREAVERAKTQGTYSTQYRYRHATGRWIWIEDTARVVRDTDGHAVRMVGVSRDITDQKRAEAQQQRRQQINRFLSEAQTVLASSLDYEATLATVIRLTVPTIADWAFIDLLDSDGGSRRVSVAFADAGKAEHARQLKKYAPRPDRLGQPGAMAMFGRRTIFCDHFTPETLRSYAQDEQHLRAMHAIEPKSMVCVPLVARERTLGALTLLTAESERMYDDEDVQLAEELARRASIAVDNARLFQEAEGKNRLIRTVTDNASTAIFLLDQDGRATYMNPAAEAMTGYSSQEACGKELHELIHATYPDGRPFPPEDCEICQAATHQGELRGHEDVFIRKDGTRFPVRCAASAIRDAGPMAGIVLEAQDISDELKQQQALARLIAQERFRASQVRKLATAALTIHSALTIENVLQVSTTEAQRLIGAHQSISSMTACEQWSQPIHCSVFSDKYAAWRRRDLEPSGEGIEALVCRTNKPIRLTQAQLEADPAWQASANHPNRPPMRGWLAAPLVGRDGKNLGLIQLTDKYDFDFSEEDEAILVQLAAIASVAIENARLYQELREADRRKDEFLAMLAHELRNPLAPIRNALMLLGLESLDEETSAEARAIMHRQVDHLVRLVDDLLDVSRIMRGKVELRREPVLVSTIVERAVETARPLIAAQDHELTVELPDHPVWVHADLVRMAQVISNLLNNAAKYTEPQGEISLRIEEEQGGVVFRVRDNGMGIEPHLLSKVFDLFTQADRSVERSQGGLGIGLTLVRTLVEMHGGRISAFSEGPGRGSEFVVALPVEAHSEAAQPTQWKPKPGRHLRVLVVEDLIGSAKMMAAILQKLWKHEVALAHDGLDAVEMAREFRPDLVLLDIGLPGISGYEVARRLRQDPVTKETVIVALTGYGTAEDRRQAEEAGFDDHLVKPASVESLQMIFCDPRLT